MLLPPLVYSRPGENGSPSGASEFTGECHPGEGPYVLVNGKYFSIGVVKDLARAFELLLTDEAQAVFEKIVRDHATLTVEHAATLAQQAEREQEFIALKVHVDDLEAEIAELHVVQNRQSELADVAAEFIAAATASVKASKPTEQTKTRNVAA